MSPSPLLAIHVTRTQGRLPALSNIREEHGAACPYPVEMIRIHPSDASFAEREEGLCWNLPSLHPVVNLLLFRKIRKSDH